VSAAAGLLDRGRALRELELTVSRRLDTIIQGDLRGLLPGTGTETADSRPYLPGDDVRRMDWNLLARTGEPHVRDTIGDRSLTTWLVIDATASVDFGTQRCEKRDLALAAAASFGLLSTRAGGSVGALVYDGVGSWVLPPRAGRDGVMGLLHRLEGRPRADLGRPSLALALRRVRLTAQRRGMVVVITDLLDDGPWARELRGLGTRHDVVVAELRDPREHELPAVGLLWLVDPETGRKLEVQTASRRTRERFAAAAGAGRGARTREVRAAGAGHLVLSTDGDWLIDVVRYVAARRKLR
jgi:uncharacterized protein (DUF58 family)